MMTGSIFQDFALWLNSISGTSNQMRWKVSGTCDVYRKITIPSGSIISPDFPAQDTKKFTITMFDWSRKGKDGRIAGIDNYENKPLHQHLNGSAFDISGTRSIGNIGSLAFLGLFPSVF